MAEGFKGLLDFIGYPVGVVSVSPSAGYFGLLDFTGIPVGIPSGQPPQQEVSEWIIRARRRGRRM